MDDTPPYDDTNLFADLTVDLMPQSGFGIRLNNSLCGVSRRLYSPSIQETNRDVLGSCVFQLNSRMTLLVSLKCWQRVRHLVIFHLHERESTERAERVQKYLHWFAMDKYNCSMTIRYNILSS